MPSRNPLFAGTKWHIFPHGAQLTPERREREFLIGAPLVMVPSVFSIPVWLVFVHTPRFSHSAIIAGAIYLAFAVALVTGIGKLLRCLRIREIDLISAMAFGVLLVFCVMLVYACVLFFALSRGLASV